MSMYPKIGGVVTWSGGQMVLQRAEAYGDEHPLVLERPDLFTSTAPGERHPSPARVESGMQRPGETRTERAVTQAPPRKASDQ